MNSEANFIDLKTFLKYEYTFLSSSIVVSVAYWHVTVEGDTLEGSVSALICEYIKKLN